MKFGLSEATIEKICAVLARYPQVETAVLYGSRAKGNYKPGSDIDLTLYGGEDLSLRVLLHIMSEIDDLLLPYTIDLSIYHTISNPDLIDHIERVGVPFYEREAVDKINNEQAGLLASAAKPAVSASLQKLLDPFPLQDFAATLNGDSLKTRAWVRAGGLRLAPVVLNWQNVDNPVAAAAFVDELEQRQAEISGVSRLLSPLDYWLIWVLVGVTAVIIPIILRQQRDRS